MSRENWSPVWGALFFTLGWNACRHVRGKSTICCSREDVPRGVVAVILGWLIAHYEGKRK